MFTKIELMPQEHKIFYVSIYSVLTKVCLFFFTAIQLYLIQLKIRPDNIASLCGGGFFNGRIPRGHKHHWGIWMAVSRGDTYAKG
jgi:hypothetical protein